MLQEKHMYRKIFASTFMLSALTFGGGYVIVSLMRKKFVDERHWIERKDILDIITLAQTAPGAVAVNASILLGYRVAGFRGALSALCGTILPPMIIIGALSFFYTAFRENRVIAAILKGMQAGIAAVIADVAIGMAMKLIHKKEIIAVIIMLASFIAVFVFSVNVLYVILFCALIGVLSTVHKNPMNKAGESL